MKKINKVFSSLIASFLLISAFASPVYAQQGIGGNTELTTEVPYKKSKQVDYSTATGDSSNSIMWWTIFAGSATAITAAVIYGGMKKRNN